MARIPLVLALLCLAGCAATRRHFIPREGLNATSPRGWPAARYQLVIAGQSVGETKVWSEGAYRAEVGDDERTILHVGFEIENRSGEEMTFLVDRCQVVDAINDGDPLPDLRPFDEKDKLQVRTGQVG
ncbi:MAG TPA: hypothetical protein VK081_14205, partial [Planctomycetota bacterium]|nr:hypothetical protein [Planctomycetota bacterium]